MATYSIATANIGRAGEAVAARAAIATVVPAIATVTAIAAVTSAHDRGAMRAVLATPAVLMAPTRCARAGSQSSQENHAVHALLPPRCGNLLNPEVLDHAALPGVVCLG